MEQLRPNSRGFSPLKLSNPFLSQPPVRLPWSILDVVWPNCSSCKIKMVIRVVAHLWIYRPDEWNEDSNECHSRKINREEQEFEAQRQLDFTEFLDSVDDSGLANKKSGSDNVRTPSSGSDEPRVIRAFLPGINPDWINRIADYLDFKSGSGSLHAWILREQVELVRCVDVWNDINDRQDDSQEDNSEDKLPDWLLEFSFGFPFEFWPPRELLILLCRVFFLVFLFATSHF